MGHGAGKGLGPLLIFERRLGFQPGWELNACAIRTTAPGCKGTSIEITIRAHKSSIECALDLPGNRIRPETALQIYENAPSPRILPARDEGE
jgi:hypothetical protein